MPDSQMGIIDILLKNFHESSILQNPLFAVKYYPLRSIRYFVLLENETPIGGCLVSEYLLNAEIQFGPISNNSDDSIILINYISNYYKKRFYGKINLRLPFYLNDFKSWFFAICLEIYKKYTVNIIDNYEGQKEFLEEEPNRFKELEYFIVNDRIKDEYSHLWMQQKWDYYKKYKKYETYKEIREL